MRWRLLALALTLGLAACKGDRPAPPAASGERAAAGLPPLQAEPAPKAATSGATLTGTVRERIDAPPYSYLRLETAAGEQWAAVLQADVKTGEQVTIRDATPMENFESKSLGRRFDRIIFGELAAGGSPPPPATGHTAVPAAPGVAVPRAEGAGAATVAEVFAGKAKLADHEVAVRGKVVKYNGAIMGKNWLHLQDGSGNEAAGDHDLAITTSDEAAVGDVVTARGVVHLDRDFGAGYAYGVIVEDAKLSR